VARTLPDQADTGADWHRRVVDRSLRTATQRSIDRGSGLVRAAAALLERSNGESFTVQDVADEAGQSLRTLYQYFESKDDLLLAVFEEAMRTYADLIRDAVAPLDDPLERLAGALLAALRIPEHAPPGVTLGMTRLRRRLTRVEPELVGRSQKPVVALVRQLLAAAMSAGRVGAGDLDAATFLLLSLTTASIASATIGDDHGSRRPDPIGLVAFALRGLGARPEPGWLAAIDTRLRLPRSR
jgi:AcrR family transcriptional regulator